MATYTGDDTDNSEDLFDTYEFNVMEGKGGNDSLYGGLLRDYINGGSGNDLLVGREGEDALTALSGDDRLFAGAGDDSLDGGSGNDYLDGSTGDDLIYLGDEGSVPDTVIGGPGDDHIVIGIGVEQVDGGQGEDIIDFQYARAGVGANLETGAGANGDTYRSIEDIVGSAFKDFLIGNGAYNDVAGGAGDDLVRGGAGGDYLDGGDGVDALDYRTSDFGVVIDLATSRASRGDAQGDSIRNFESVNGSDFDDVLAGSEDGNRLLGYGGNDFLGGRGGVDALNGMTGNDRVYGGTGADQLIGGAGADRFEYRAIGDTGTAAAARDRIVDFSHAAGDRIDLRGIDANSEATGNQAFAFKGTGGFGGANGELRYFGQMGDAVVIGDVNGDRVADFAIHLDAVATLVAGDFYL